MKYEPCFMESLGLPMLLHWEEKYNRNKETYNSTTNTKKLNT